jgi:hypothetical protein
MNILKEDEFIKNINIISFLIEYYLEYQNTNYNRVELLYWILFLDYGRCNEVVLSVTITNTIRTLIYRNYWEMNEIKYMIPMRIFFEFSII